MILDYLHENFGIGAFEFYAGIFIFVAVMIGLYGRHGNPSGQYGSGGLFVSFDLSSSSDGDSGGDCGGDGGGD